jgi:hypothetical protein
MHGNEFPPAELFQGLCAVRLEDYRNSDEQHVPDFIQHPGQGGQPQLARKNGHNQQDKKPLMSWTARVPLYQHEELIDNDRNNGNI